MAFLIYLADCMPRVRRGVQIAATVSTLLVLLSGAVRAQGQAPVPAPVPQLDILTMFGRILGKEAAPAETPGQGSGKAITLLPSFSVSPSTGLALGASGNLVQRFGPAETTNLSAFNAGVSYTTKGQLNITSRSNLFTANNRLKFEGDWRYLNTNQETFGLGPAHPESDRDLIKFNQFRFYQTIYFRLTGRLMVGPGYLLDHHFDIIDENADSGLASPVVEYEGANLAKTTSSGWSLNALIDSRDSPIYPTRGIMAAGSFRNYSTGLGSTNNWNELQLEFRAYQRLDAATKHVLAFWGISRISDGHAPYHDLPAIGWDTNNRSGRGYLQGRIRGTKMLYGEAEFRTVLTRNGLLGAVAFANFTSAADAVTRKLGSPDVGGGFGLRVKLNAKARSNITLDYAFGPNGSKGFFMGTSEAF
jgi:outer membrane protein assembly factor BamA